MNKIVIDSRYFGKSGIGQTCKGILDNIQSFENIILLGNKEVLSKKYPKATIIDNNSNPFSRKAFFLTKKEKKIINASKCFFSPAYIVPYGIKTNIVTIIHDCVFFDEKETTNNIFDKFIKKHCYKRAINKSKIVFTISNFSKSRIKDLFRIDDKKLKMIISGCLSKDIIEYRNENTLPSSKENSIVFVGNIKKHKGLDTLLEAFKIAKTKDSSLKLYIIGNIDGLRSKLNLSHNFDLKDVFVQKNVKNHELFEIISRCKYLVQPSRYEGMGLTPLEALYLKTNVVLNDIPVFHEFYEKNCNVEFFKLNDSSSLSKLILNIPKYTDQEEFFNYFDYKKTVKTILETINNL